MVVFEVREELYAVVDGAALLPCACRRDLTCIPCRARTLKGEITARGIRTHRWRNDPASVPRLVSHVAGLVDVQREPRRSCPRYITDRTQGCAHCGQVLAAGKWGLFFDPGTSVTMLRLRDGTQAFPQPARAGRDSITCAQLARIESKKPPRTRYTNGVKCGRICGMNRARRGNGVFRTGRLPYGWTRVDGVITVVPAQQAIRSTVMQLRARGMSYRRIAGILNDSGYTSADGVAWSAMGVQRIVVTLLDQVLVEALQSSPGQFTFFGQAAVTMTDERMEDKRTREIKKKASKNVA